MNLGWLLPDKYLPLVPQDYAASFRTTVLPSVPFTSGCFSSSATAFSASAAFAAGGACFFWRPCGNIIQAHH